MSATQSTNRRALTSFTAWQFHVSFVALAISFAVFGVIVSARDWHNNQVATRQAVQKIAAAHNGDTKAATAEVPDTNPPSSDAVSTYNVAAEYPRYIDIPRLGIHARVLNVGLANDGSIATPANVHDAAWYNGSVKPGEQGAALIDGHVSSWSARGVFYNLTALAAGDTFAIERGDGTILQYKVIKTAVYDAGLIDMSAVLSSIEPSQPGLNLISCTGNVLDGTNDFSERVVVYSVQM